MSYFAHETACIDENASIGEGTKIWHFSHIMSHCTIGTSCNIGQNVVISPNVSIGHGVKIQNNVSLYTGLVVEDHVFLGPSCVFTNVINPRAFIQRKEEFRETIIGIGASVGANATIICGHHIGKYALIGAGAVVTKDVPDYGLVVGNPSKIIGYVCQCGVTLQLQEEKATCEACGIAYLKEDQMVRCCDKMKN